jgi:phosphatidylglycerophosphatase B
VLLLMAVVWLLPVAFIVTGTHNILILSAYWITESAGKYGTMFLIICAGYFYSIRYSTFREKLIAFLRSIASLVIFLAVFAFMNECLIKPVAGAVRPSHRFLLTETNSISLLDSVYRLSKDDRRLFFARLVEEHHDRFLNIDPRVLQHWITEAGFSFPSGHSFNAFMLATIFAFSLRKASKEKYHKYYALPFVWAFLVALSRVMIGAHTPLDVTFGATIGLSIALTFLYFDTTRRWIIHKEIPRNNKR